MKKVRDFEFLLRYYGFVRRGAVYNVSKPDGREKQGSWLGVRLTHTEADEERKIDCVGSKWLLYLSCTNGDSLPERAKPKRANQPHQQHNFSVFPFRLLAL